MYKGRVLLLAGKKRWAANSQKNLIFENWSVKQIERVFFGWNQPLEKNQLFKEL